jgi:hypothetical protein
MSSVNSVSPSATDLGDMAIKARDGKALMDQMLSQSSFGSAPSQNDLAQENKNGIAAIAAAGKAATSSSSSTSSKDNIAQENKNGVAAKAAAGAVASANSSSDSGTIDYAAVHMEDLKGQLHNAKNEPPGPARDAKVAQLKTDIAAAKANASSSTSSGSTDSTSTDNSTSSSGSSTSSAKAVKSKLEGEIKKLEAQLKEQSESGDSTVQDKLNRLHKDLNHVNRLVKAENTDIDVTA